MPLPRFHRFTGFAVSALLFAAALRSAWTGEFTALRWGILLGAAGLAAAAPGPAIVFAVFAAPLLPIVSRLGLERGDLSLGEQLVVGMLPVLLWKGARESARVPRSAVDTGLASFTAVVLASFFSVLWQYRDLGVGPVDFFTGPLRWLFDPGIGAFAIDRFVVLRHTLVFVLGALWWMALIRGAPSLRASQLRGALVAGLLVCVLVGVAQFHWRFAPVRLPDGRDLALFRISATMPGNNILAVYLCLLAPLALSASWRRPWMHGRLVAVGALLAFAITAAASRSAWVAVFVCGLAAAWFVAGHGERLGLRSSARLRRPLASAVVALVVLPAGAAALVTAFDLRRDVDYTRAASVGDLALITLNLRRPPDEILSGRVAYWQRALALWGDHPLFGIGVGRYALWKTSPADGVVAAGPGGTGSSVSVGAAPFERWVNAGPGVKFDAMDVLPGDTIESTRGGWGPVPIEGRWSATQLILASPAPRGENLDFVVRHPPFDPALRAHAHRYPLPLWTSAHNFYLQLLSELGIVGLAAFFVLMATVAVEIRRGLGLPRPEQRRTAAAAGFGIATLLVNSLAEDPLAMREMQIVFWALVAMVVLQSREAARET